MRLAIGSTQIATAGTEIQFSADSQIGSAARMIWGKFKPRPNNTGNIAVGVVSMTITDGYSMVNTDTVGLVLDFREMGTGGKHASILASTIWFDAATNGDYVDWAVIIEN